MHLPDVPNEPCGSGGGGGESSSLRREQRKREREERKQEGYVILHRDPPVKTSPSMRPDDRLRGGAADHCGRAAGVAAKKGPTSEAPYAPAAEPCRRPGQMRTCKRPRPSWLT